MLLSKRVELIKKMSSKATRNPIVSITEKQVKFLYKIFKLEQLIDDVIYTLVKEINSWGTLAYQKKTEEKSSTLLIEGKTDKETIYNLTINLISEEKLSEIPKEI